MQLGCPTLIIIIGHHLKMCHHTLPKHNWHLIISLGGTQMCEQSYECLWSSFYSRQFAYVKRQHICEGNLIGHVNLTFTTTTPCNGERTNQWLLWPPTQRQEDTHTATTTSTCAIINRLPSWIGLSLYPRNLPWVKVTSQKLPTLFLHPYNQPRYNNNYCTL